MVQIAQHFLLNSNKMGFWPVQKALQSKYKYAINTYFVLRLSAVLHTHLFTAAANVVLSVYITYRQVEHG